VTSIAGIGALARLNGDESEFSAQRSEDYIVVDFLLFAELDDGRRVETVAVYQEGGPRNGWGPVDGQLVDRQLSRARIESMATLMVGPDGALRHAWKGVTARLELAGVSVPIDDLFAAPFRVETEQRLDEALAASQVGSRISI
jgi:hypothetical protein